MKPPPATVKVGPHEFRVVVVPDDVLINVGKAGSCDAQGGVIAIDGRQTKSQLADTLLHELTHAMLDVLDFEAADEERICLALGPGLLALLRDNPALVKWLTR